LDVKSLQRGIRTLGMLPLRTTRWAISTSSNWSQSTIPGASKSASRLTWIIAWRNTVQPRLSLSTDRPGLAIAPGNERLPIVSRTGLTRFARRCIGPHHSTKFCGGGAHFFAACDPWSHLQPCQRSRPGLAKTSSEPLDGAPSQEHRRLDALWEVA